MAEQQQPSRRARDGDGVTSTVEPEFYDVAMTAPHEPAMLPLEESPWRVLYERAAAWISPTHAVVDLACGTGRFAEQLRRRGHGPYTGLDFSPATLAAAEAYVPLFDVDTAWDCKFELADLREWKADPNRATMTVYTCLETLEHLEDDVDLIKRIPPGHTVIFSVPNYGGEAHLRVFENASDAITRYGNFLTFTDWALIGDGPRYHIHLYRARRRGDSW
jgi:2-polyprenyl-3-methyl-5-hydroxy-6-metoxy-1,4-benzoquinol methylase